MKGRQCGGCTLCCKLLPVRELGKVANQRCQHQCAAGCRVYRKAAMPPSCRIWTCQWLSGTTSRDVRRPDRSHYVIDIMPDYCTMLDNATGATFDIPVVVVWCDPGHREAHRDPALRDWLEATQRCALVRFDSQRAIFLAPPPCNTEGVWYEGEEHESTLTHSPQDLVEKFNMRVRIVETEAP